MSGTIWEKPINWNTSGKSAQVERLESRVRELEAKRDRLKAEVKDLRYSLEHIEGDERYANLRSRHAAMVELCKTAVHNWENHRDYSLSTNMVKLRAALLEEGPCPKQR
jgi:hypothetical protein